MSFKTQLITEASVSEIALKVYIPKMTELIINLLSDQAKEHADWENITRTEIADVIGVIASCDPTGPGYVSRTDVLEGSASGVPGKYTKVILQWVLNGLKAMPKGLPSAYGITGMVSDFLIPRGYTFSGLTSDLETYETLVKYITGPEKSFSYFKDPNSFRTFIHSAATGELVVKAKADRAAKESEVVYEDATWKVIYPKSHFASAYYGKGTDWCTTRPSDSNYYNQYSKAGFLFMAMNKDSPGNSIQLYSQRVQGTGPEEMCAHADDQFANIEIVLYGYPDLMAFFNKVAAPAVKESIEIWEREASESPRRTRRYGPEAESDYDVRDPDDHEEEEEEEEVSYSTYASSELSEELFTFRPSGVGVRSVDIDLNEYVDQRVGDDDDGQAVNSENLEFTVIALTPDLLDESCLGIKEVNFSTKGLLVIYDGTSPADMDQSANSYIHDEQGYYDGDDAASNECMSAMWRAADKLGIAGPVGYFVLARYYDLTVSSSDLRSFASSTSPSVFNGDSSEIYEGELTIGGRRFNVSIAINEDFGDLSDALDDPKFKKLVDGGFYTDHDANREGQQDFEFSSLSAPSQSVDGIVAPVGVVDMVNYDKAVRAPVHTKHRRKKKSS